MVLKSNIQTQKNSGGSILFFLAFTLGAFAIVCLKYFGAHQVIVTAVPVIIMFAYAFMVYYLRQYRLRLDQAGDNLYYLGFLFTLISLAYSLVEFAASDTSTVSIISNFGIAIASTIVGLALRVFFSQMRTDPIEIEHVARIELAETSRRLRRELNDSANEFSMFRRSLQQMTTESFQELQKNIQETVGGGLTSFDENIEKFSTSVTEANEGFRKSGDSLNLNATKLVDTMSSLIARMDAVEFPADSFDKKLQPVIDKLNDTIVGFNESVSSFSTKLENIDVPNDILLKKLQPAIDKISEAGEVAKNQVSMDTAQTQIWSELNTRVAETAETFDKSLISVKTASELFSEGAKSVHLAATEMKKLTDYITDDKSKIDSIVEKSHEKVQKSIDNMVKDIDGIAVDIAKQAKEKSLELGGIVTTPSVQTQTIPTDSSTKSRWFSSVRKNNFEQGK